MIPPRVSLDNEIEKEPSVGCEPDLQRSLGPLYDTPCVARFPGWPHGNRTHNGSTSVARKARSRTWGPLPRTLFAFPIWAPYGLYTEAIHRECTICSFAVLSPLPRYVHRYLPIISTLLADFDRQFDYGCHSHRTCDIGVHPHAFFSRDRRTGRGTHWKPICDDSSFTIPFLKQNHNRQEKDLQEKKKTKNSPGKNYPSSG